MQNQLHNGDYIGIKWEMFFDNHSSFLWKFCSNGWVISEKILEYAEKTTDMLQVTGKLYRIKLNQVYFFLFTKLSGNRHMYSKSNYHQLNTHDLQQMSNLQCIKVKIMNSQYKKKDNFGRCKLTLSKFLLLDDTCTVHPLPVYKAKW
jgi:hypothetical protein